MRLRDRGLPRTAMFQRAEVGRMEEEAQRWLQRQRGYMGPARPIRMPRAEPQEVKQAVEKDATGKWVGRRPCYGLRGRRLFSFVFEIYSA